MFTPHAMHIQSSYLLSFVNEQKKQSSLILLYYQFFICDKNNMHSQLPPSPPSPLTPSHQIFRQLSFSPVKNSTFYLQQPKLSCLYLLYLQLLPVQSVEIFGTPLDFTFIWFFFCVHSYMDFQTVRSQESLSTSCLVTNKGIFTYKKQNLLISATVINITINLSLAPVFY